MSYDPFSTVPIHLADNAKPSHEALLEAVERMAAIVATPEELRDLAEAWAWIMYPNMSHGGHSQSA
jgi:hypothetical protein